MSNGWSRPGISANLILSVMNIWRKYGSKFIQIRSLWSWKFGFSIFDDVNYKIFTWSLFFLIYCQREWIIVLLVAVWTPNNRARRTSSLNWDGSWFNMNIIVHFTSRSPKICTNFTMKTSNFLRTRSFYLKSVSFLCVLLSVPLHQVVIWTIKFFVQLDNERFEKCWKFPLGLSRSCFGIVSTRIMFEYDHVISVYYLLSDSCSRRRPSTRSSQFPVEFDCCGFAG